MTSYNYVVAGATPLFNPNNTYAALGASTSTPVGLRYDTYPKSLLPIPAATPTSAYQG